MHNDDTPVDKAQRDRDVDAAIGLLTRHFRTVIVIAGKAEDGAEMLAGQGASPKECAGYALDAAQQFLEAGRENAIVDSHTHGWGHNVRDIMGPSSSDPLVN